MQHSHPWKLVGPWYRWHDPASAPLPQPQPQPASAGAARPELGRNSRPIIQKYAAAKFVDEFLKDPQRCLRFDQSDFVHVTENRVYRQAQPQLRKIFLSTHSRFYLIVCELHCDTVGFPTVTRDQVCEAGFVVRRRRVPIPHEAQGRFEAAVAKAARARHQSQEAERKARSSPDVWISGTTSNRDQRQRATDKSREQLEAAQKELLGLIDEYKIERRIEGWVPSRTEGIGSWQPVEEAPGEIICDTTFAPKESYLPLYPLVPDPTRSDHSSEGRSIWFGVLPTGDAVVDETGQPRFDDRQVYEARCFVRRHRAGCPRRRGPNDCGGELVWSPATESFRLAAQFDLEGTGQRHVSVQVPDLRTLEAQVKSPDFRLAGGMALVTPRDSELAFDVNGDGKPINPGRSPGASICFFAIPLITIVALFVLRLFLPIVVFLFQLWFLLLLKFCIPPTFSLDAGLAADLEAALDAELDIQGQLRADLVATVNANLGADQGAALASGTSPRELAQKALTMASDFSGDAPADLAGNFDPPRLPAPLTGTPASRPRELPGSKLVYYERVYSELRA